MLLKGRIPGRGVLIDAPLEIVPAEHVVSILLGLYESDEVRFIRRYLHHGLDVMEIGSGIGVVSAHILGKLAKRDKLVCLEANPNLVPGLKRNIELNAPGAEVVVMNRALDYSGKEMISLTVDRKNLGSHVRRQPGVQVRAISLKDVIREAKLSDYALVCDAEGAETGMILHDSEGLSRCRLLIIELHRTVHAEREYTVADLRRALEVRHGFSLVASRHAVHVFEKAALLQ